MSEKSTFVLTYQKEIVSRGIKKIFHVNTEHVKRFNKTLVLSGQEGNDILFEQLQSNSHFFASRLGGIELRLLEEIEQVKLGIKKTVPDKWREIAWNNSGMFSIDDQGLGTFYQEYLQGISNISLLGVWGNVMEDYMVKKYGSSPKPMDLMAYESFLYKKPWTLALEGKKVLIVNPFSETIQKQYLKRNLIFSSNPSLPTFKKLYTYKPIVSFKGIAQAYPTWSDALKAMENDISIIDFDVAIIGCGSYGLPLGSFIFKMGKTAIHVGGATQVLFGIKGKRWDERSYMKNVYNDYWVRPSKDEKPVTSNNIEDGCYW